MPLIVGLLVAVEEVANSQNLKKCLVQVSSDEEQEKLTIVTNAKNVKQGMRVIVAPVGMELEDVGVVESRVVGGVRSSGMLCDSKMCGWASTNPGLAVSLPDTFELGSEAPSQNPRSATLNATATSGDQVEGELSIKQKKELEKAARKATLKEKRAEKAAAKKGADS